MFVIYLFFLNPSSSSSSYTPGIYHWLYLFRFQRPDAPVSLWYVLDLLLYGANHFGPLFNWLFHSVLYFFFLYSLQIDSITAWYYLSSLLPPSNVYHFAFERKHFTNWKYITTCGITINWKDTQNSAESVQDIVKLKKNTAS